MKSLIEKPKSNQSAIHCAGCGNIVNDIARRMISEYGATGDSFYFYLCLRCAFYLDLDIYPDAERIREAIHTTFFNEIHKHYGKGAGS